VKLGEKIDKDTHYQHYCTYHIEAMIKKAVEGEELGTKVGRRIPAL